MEIFSDFLNWLPTFLGDEIYVGIQWGLIIGPLMGLVIWPFFGRDADQVVGWAVAGMFGGGLLAAGIRAATFMTGLREATSVFRLNANQGVGTAALINFGIAIAIGAGVGLLLAVLIQELQRAITGAVFGVPAGVVVAIPIVFAWRYLPGLPAFYLPIFIGVVILIVTVFLASNYAERLST